MGNIQDFLTKIRKERYGKDVREAIAGGIEQCYQDGKAGSEDAYARQKIDQIEPDVTKLKTDVDLQNVHLSTLEVDEKGLELFGWIAPVINGVGDYIADGVYHKKIGRVDLGSLSWTVSGTRGCYSTALQGIVKIGGEFFSNYENGGQAWGDVSGGKLGISDSGLILYGDSAKTPSGYLYYELATEQTYSIYNPNVLDTIGTTTNMINPTLGSTVVNGITITNNSDGTYTLNGTAGSGGAYITISNNINVENGKILRLVGCPIGGRNNNKSNYILYVANATSVSGGPAYDYGDGVNVKFSSATSSVRILVTEGTVCNNLVFKPMLTTNLQADYSQFVPYTGSTGRLNSDVAEIKSKIMCGTFTFTPTMTQFSDNKLYADRKDKSITIKGLSPYSVVHVMVHSEHSAWVGRVATAKDTITRMNLYATENITSQMTFKYIAINQ